LKPALNHDIVSPLSGNQPRKFFTLASLKRDAKFIRAGQYHAYQFPYQRGL